MSRRRRILLATVAAALVGLLVAVLVVVWPRPAVPRPVPAQDLPGPVLLVPGYGGGTAGVTALAQRIRATGRDARVVALPDSATGDLGEQAHVLDAAVADLLAHGSASVDIIGYSAGGVVARLWVQRYDGVHKARRVVTLGSPHHGAQLAAVAAGAVPGACPPACLQLAPGSHLLTGLTTPVPVPPQWLSVWTEQDQTVVPPESAKLEGAVNLAVQSVCPGRSVSHAQLPTDGFVTALVLAAIGPGPVPVPGTCLSS